MEKVAHPANLPDGVQSLGMLVDGPPAGRLRNLPVGGPFDSIMMMMVVALLMALLLSSRLAVLVALQQGDPAHQPNPENKGQE